MKIDHISLWTKNLERMREFYLYYFDCESNEKYVNPAKGYSSYFIRFEDGSRIELMNRTDIYEKTYHLLLGYAHLAINVGSKEKVDMLTQQLSSDGYTIDSQPRTTGDGYYESVVKDPEGNRIELVA